MQTIFEFIQKKKTTNTVTTSFKSLVSCINAKNVYNGHGDIQNGQLYCIQWPDGNKYKRAFAIMTGKEKQLIEYDGPMAGTYISILADGRVYIDSDIAYPEGSTEVTTISDNEIDMLLQVATRLDNDSRFTVDFKYGCIYTDTGKLKKEKSYGKFQNGSTKYVRY